jgi:hypothetical protein
MNRGAGMSHPATGGPVVITTLGTELTSPTNYVSLATVYASDACNAVGATHHDTIIPLPTESPLTSMWGYPMPTLNWQWGPVASIITGFAPFSVTDLIEPVPVSAYQSQPWCAQYLVEAYAASQGNTFSPNMTCPSTRPYEPILVVPTQALTALDPAWGSCRPALNGL